MNNINNKEAKLKADCAFRWPKTESSDDFESSSFMQPGISCQPERPSLSACPATRWYPARDRLMKESGVLTRASCPRAIGGPRSATG